MKSVTSVTDLQFEVDTSDKECNLFGFCCEDEVRVPGLNNTTGVVVGVAPIPGDISSGCTGAGDKVLWIRMDDNTDGKVCFFPNPSIDLEKI
ncbi:hypothetical protein ACFL0L_02255 [Patescibacteria group bacterium]